MHPVEFKHYNTVFAEDQMPALRTEDGHVITCWRLTWRERFTVLLRGALWLDQLTFNTPLQPQRPTVHRPFTVQDPDADDA